MELRHGDRVFIRNLGLEGQVIEVNTRTIVVRYKKEDGELIEHRFQPEDLEYRPKRTYNELLPQEADLQRIDVPLAAS